MKKLLRVGSLLMVVGILVGCSGAKDSAESATPPDQTTASSSPSTAEKAESGGGAPAKRSADTADYK